MLGDWLQYPNEEPKNLRPHILEQLAQSSFNYQQHLVNRYLGFLQFISVLIWLR